MTKDHSLAKLPPQAIEAEESILSSCLLGAANDVVELLRADNFYRTAHQTIFESIERLVGNKQNVDLTTLVSDLRANKKLTEVGGAAYIARLIDTVPSSTSVANHASIVKEAYHKRKIIQACSETIQQCYTGDYVADIMGGLEQKMSSIDLIADNFYRIGDILNETIEKLEKLKLSPGITGIPTGLIDFDKKTGGLQRGELFVLGARPSMGKSALGMRMARGAARSGVPCLFVSIEMPRHKIVCRELSCVSQVDGGRFRRGEFDAHHWRKIADAAGKVSGMPLWIDDATTAEIKTLQSKIRKFVREHSGGLVVVDYLQYVRGIASERQDIEIGTISRGLAVSAKENDVSVLLLAQLSRALESRPDKHPIMSDLRGSGEIEQDADIIAFLYRDEVYNPDTKYKNVAELDFKKFREGEPGRIYLTWIPHRTTFENLIRGY